MLELLPLPREELLERLLPLFLLPPVEALPLPRAVPRPLPPLPPPLPLPGPPLLGGPWLWLLERPLGPLVLDLERPLLVICRLLLVPVRPGANFFLLEAPSLDWPLCRFFELFCCWAWLRALLTDWLTLAAVALAICLLFFLIASASFLAMISSSCLGVAVGSWSTTMSVCSVAAVVVSSLFSFLSAVDLALVLACFWYCSMEVVNMWLAK